jgi:hypothetical protein
MTDGLLISVWLNICAFPHIHVLGSPSSYMTLQPIPSEFPYISGKFRFLFHQCSGRYCRVQHRKTNPHLIQRADRRSAGVLGSGGLRTSAVLGSGASGGLGTGASGVLGTGSHGYVLERKKAAKASCIRGCGIMFHFLKNILLFCSWKFFFVLISLTLTIRLRLNGYILCVFLTNFHVFTRVFGLRKKNPFKAKVSTQINHSGS